MYVKIIAQVLNPYDMLACIYFYNIWEKFIINVDILTTNVCVPILY